MKIPLQWLQEWTPVEIDLHELDALLTMGGFGVESIDTGDIGPVLTLEITSNRGDWLSVYGVAREIAAIRGGDLKPYPVGVAEAGAPCADAVKVTIEAPDLCPRYSARLVRGVKVASSPLWMQQRLAAAGVRPINNVVDATNYVMLEMGQPLHAFDFGRITQGHIIVRRAREGETLFTIDGDERPLNNDMLVIADAECAVAVAGVMGGLASEVSETTVNVLLESAHFDPRSVRRTAKALAMRTEASYRFERWVDPARTTVALDRVAALILETAGGECAAGIVDAYPAPMTPPTVELRPEVCAQWLGVDLSSAEQAELLRRLQINVAGSAPLVCTIPTHRNDIHREPDLIEEIARLYGYDNIPVTIHHGIAAKAGPDRRRRHEEQARDLLVACGMTEAVTFSLTDVAAADRAGLPNTAEVRTAVVLRNPMTEEYTQLRTSLLPSMLTVLENNARQRRYDVRLFEIGKVYLPQPGRQLPEERRVISLAVAGAALTSPWNVDVAACAADFFTLKGIVEELLRGFGVPGARFVTHQQDTFHPFRCAELQIDGVPAGVLGELHPDVAERYQLRPRVYLAELNFDAITTAAVEEKRFVELPRHPGADRDVALVIGEAVSCEDVTNTIRAAAPEILESVGIFDKYSGPQIGAGRKSVAFTLRFQALQRSLTDDEVESAMERIRDALRTNLGAEIRA